MTGYDETFPDIGSMSDEELKDLIDELTDEEREVSYRRRVLHGKIDILRAELVNRLKAKREAGSATITGADVQQLTDILLGKVPTRARETASSGLTAGREAPWWLCTAPSAASSTPRAPTTARSAAPTSARPEGADEPTDDDLQGRRDRRIHADRHRRGGRARPAPRW